MPTRVPDSIYAQYFGARLLKEVLHLMPELHEAYHHPLEKHPILHNFLQHLSSPTLRPPKDEVNEIEAGEIDRLRQTGREKLPVGNPWNHIRNGFHAAFPEGEHPKVTKQKALDARNHFRQFMSERGGHSHNFAADLTGSNGKTRMSSGMGVLTKGLSLAPGKTTGYNHDVCPRASGECRKNCLGLTASANRYATSFKSKLLRTQYLHEHPEHAARLMSHEISNHEKKAEKKGMKPGMRLNMTSDLPYEHLMPKHFFDRHHKTQFYDYTKIPGRLHNKDLPKNYSLALSHTGTGHNESNDRDVVHALRHGHVVAMVHKRGIHQPKPTHVMDMQTGEKYPLTTGDSDDNIFDRHQSLGLVHGKHGVVSGLKLKGVSNKTGGHFANQVDPDGIIRINHQKPQHHNPFNVLK